MIPVLCIVATMLLLILDAAGVVALPVIVIFAPVLALIATFLLVFVSGLLGLGLMAGLQAIERRERRRP